MYMKRKRKKILMFSFSVSYKYIDFDNLEITKITIWQFQNYSNKTLMQE
jgi:hypothetical protein